MSASYRYQDLKPLRQKKREQYDPDQQEILQYAQYIGIKLPDEQYMLQLAKQGINTALPQHWQACHAPDGQLVYRNTKTKIVQQEHPIDSVYKQKVIELRNEYKKYLQQQQQEGNYQQELNTIPQQKSQQKSVNESSLENDDAFMHSQQLFQHGDTLKPQQNSELDKAMIRSKSRQMSSYEYHHSDKQKQSSKFLANLSSLDHTNKNQLYGRSIEYRVNNANHQQKNIKIGIQFQKQKQKEIQKQKQKKKQRRETKLRKKKQQLKKQLQFLKKQQQINKQLLANLQNQNNQKLQKIKQYLQINNRDNKIKRAKHKYNHLKTQQYLDVL